MQDSHHQSSRRQSETGAAGSAGLDGGIIIGTSGWHDGYASEASKPRRVSVQPEDAELEVDLYVHFNVITGLFLFFSASLPAFAFGSVSL